MPECWPNVLKSRFGIDGFLAREAVWRQLFGFVVFVRKIWDHEKSGNINSLEHVKIFGGSVFGEHVVLNKLLFFVHK